MPFSTVNEILTKNIKKKSGLSRQIQAALICEEFDKIIKDKWGAKIVNQARAMYFKDNILTIASLSSVVSQEIKLNEPIILEQLNQKFKNTVVAIRYLI